MTSRWPLQPCIERFFDALLRKSYQFIIVSIAPVSTLPVQRWPFTCPKGQIPLLGTWGHWYRNAIYARGFHKPNS
jgi:hypothetical protein